MRHTDWIDRGPGHIRLGRVLFDLGASLPESPIIDGAVTNMASFDDDGNHVGTTSFGGYWFRLPGSAVADGQLARRPDRQPVHVPPALRGPTVSVACRVVAHAAFRRGADSDPGGVQQRRSGSTGPDPAVALVIATVPCPICEWPMPLDATLGDTIERNYGTEVELIVGFSDEARAHLRSHFPDGDGGEPVPDPGTWSADATGVRHPPNECAA